MFKQFSALVFSLLTVFSIQAADVKQVTVQDLAQVIATHDTDYVIIDVRTPEEFEAQHINGAVLIPLQILESRIAEIVELYSNKDIYLFCRSGNRSMQAARILAPHGLRLFNVQGGIIAWSKL